MDDKITTKVTYGNIVRETEHDCYRTHMRATMIRTIISTMAPIMVSAICSSDTKRVVSRNQSKPRKFDSKRARELRYEALDRKCNTREYGIYIASTTAIKEAYLESKGYY